MFNHFSYHEDCISLACCCLLFKAAGKIMTSSLSLKHHFIQICQLLWLQYHAFFGNITAVSYIFLTRYISKASEKYADMKDNLVSDNLDLILGISGTENRHGLNKNVDEIKTLSFISCGTYYLFLFFIALKSVQKNVEQFCLNGSHYTQF